MASKKQFCYPYEKTRRDLVALSTDATFIVLKVWNNQLNQPTFLSFFSFIIRLLEFREFLFLQYQSKITQEKRCRLIYFYILHIYCMFVAYFNIFWISHQEVFYEIALLYFLSKSLQNTCKRDLIKSWTVLKSNNFYIGIFQSS